MREALRVENLSVAYSGVKALENVSFSVERGDYVAILGPNGSGKSTLLKTLLGLEKPQSGSITLLGQKRDSFDQWGKVGYLPQKTGVTNPLFPATVEEIVSMGLLAGKRFPRLQSKEDREKTARALELCGITALAKKLIGELSGGQQQKALLARAIVSSPELILLDEPSTALDHESRIAFFTLLDGIARADGTTVIFITHDMGEAGRHAGKLLMLDTSLVFYGTGEEFCKSAAMTGVFGEHTQHLVCHRHDTESRHGHA